MRAKISIIRKKKDKDIIETKTILVKIFYLAMIDEASCWPEIMPIKNKESKSIGELISTTTILLTR